MRYLLIILLLINTAYAQGTSCFGVCTARPQDTSFTNGQVRYKAYTSGDTTICVLLTNGTMKTIPITRLAGTSYTAGYGLGLTGFQFYVDTNVVPSQYQVDTMRDNIYAVIGGLPTPSLQQVTDVDSVTSHEITIGTLPSTITPVGYDGLRVGVSTNSLNATGESARAITGASTFTGTANSSSTTVLVGAALQVSTAATSTDSIYDHDFDNPENKSAGADMVGLDSRVVIQGSGWVSSMAGVSSQLFTSSPANMRSYAGYLCIGWRRNNGTSLTNFYSDYIQERPANLGTGTLTNRYGIYMDSLVSGTNNYGIYFSNTPSTGTLYSPLDITVAAQALRISSGKFHLATTILGATSDSTLVKSGTEVKAVAPLATILADYAPASGSANYIQNGTSQQTSANFNIDGKGVMDTLAGTTSSGGSLQLQSTTHATKGNIYFENNAYFNGTTTTYQIGTTLPAGVTANNNVFSFRSFKDGTTSNRIDYGNYNVTTGLQFNGYLGLGTIASPAAVDAGRTWRMQFVGQTSSTTSGVGGALQFITTETFNSTSRGTGFQIACAINGTTVERARLKIYGNGVTSLQPDELAPVVLYGDSTDYATNGESYNVFTNGSHKISGQLKHGTSTGIIKATSGVYGIAVAGTDYVPPTTAVNGQQLTGSIVITSDDVPNDDALTGAGTYNIPATAGTIFISFTGTTSTWTLPTLASSEHASYFIKNRGSGDITLNSNAGGNDIYNTSAVNTFTISAGQSYIIHNDGTFFNIE